MGSGMTVAGIYAHIVPPGPLSVRGIAFRREIPEPMPPMSDARNDIEEKLLAAQEGRLDTEQFMEALLSAQLFMPVHDGNTVLNIQRSTRAQPLTLEGEGGVKQLVL